MKQMLQIFGNGSRHENIIYIHIVFNIIFTKEGFSWPLTFFCSLTCCGNKAKSDQGHRGRRRPRPRLWRQRPLQASHAVRQSVSQSERRHGDNDTVRRGRWVLVLFIRVVFSLVYKFKESKKFVHQLKMPKQDVAQLRIVPSGLFMCLSSCILIIELIHVKDIQIKCAIPA